MEIHQPSIPPVNETSPPTAMFDMDGILTTDRGLINTNQHDFNIHEGAPIQLLCPEMSKSGSSIRRRILVEIAWKNINIRTKSKKENRHILHDVSGIVRPGQFLAIIGASGAGKTTLLNYLSGKMLAYNLYSEGETTINRKSTKESQNYLEFTAFVQQDDVLMETMTVKESLQYAAMLKYSADPKVREERLLELLEELELNEIRDLKFGGMSQGSGRTLSRGERKRLSIAVELITNPSLLFLDEPTTSMDTFTAEKILQIVLKMKQKQRTIIATIHQPNTQIYHNFDQLMIMSLGRVIYHVNITLKLEQRIRCSKIFFFNWLSLSNR